MTPLWESDYGVWRVGRQVWKQGTCRRLCQWTRWEAMVSLAGMVALEVMRNNGSWGVC